MKQTVSPVPSSVKLFSIEETKEQLSVSRPTVNRLIASGILRTVRIGRSVRIQESALLELIERGGNRYISPKTATGRA